LIEFAASGLFNVMWAIPSRTSKRRVVYSITIPPYQIFTFLGLMITPERPGEGDDRLSFENGSLSTKTDSQIPIYSELSLRIPPWRDEAISAFSIRLPRTFQVLACMTE
jgi:hypothetical protein